MKSEAYIGSAPYSYGEWHHVSRDTHPDVIAPGGAVLVDSRSGEVHEKAEVAARKGWFQLAQFCVWVRDFGDRDHPVDDFIRASDFGRKLPVMDTVQKRIGVPCWQPLHFRGEH